MAHAVDEEISTLTNRFVQAEEAIMRGGKSRDEYVKIFSQYFEDRDWEAFKKAVFPLLREQVWETLQPQVDNAWKEQNPELVPETGRSDAYWGDALQNTTLSAIKQLLWACQPGKEWLHFTALQWCNTALCGYSEISFNSLVPPEVKEKMTAIFNEKEAA